MNKLLFAFIFLMFSSVSFGGEVMRSGDILSEDSYVFTISEAEGLMRKIEELEASNLQNEKVIAVFKELDFNTSLQIREMDSLLKLKSLEINEYEHMTSLYRTRITRLERQSKFSKVEKWGFMGIGIGLTVGSIIIADKIDDYVDNPGSNNFAPSSARMSVNFRF